MTELLYGRNAVCEALRAKRRRFYRLLLAKGTKQTAIIREIINRAQKQQIPIQSLPKSEFQHLGWGHQGIALEAGPPSQLDLFDLLANQTHRKEPSFFLALDHLEDPQNVGAILRTAEVVGIHGVILPHRRSASLTATVVNASAGAAEHLQIAIVTNLVQALQTLKQENIWVVGVDDETGSQAYHQVDLSMPLILVLGNEGKGLSQLVRRTCDLFVKVPMRGQVESLNVSVAGALVLYEVWRARKFFMRI